MSCSFNLYLSNCERDRHVIMTEPAVFLTERSFENREYCINSVKTTKHTFRGKTWLDTTKGLRALFGE